jgi:predicted metal-dependent hydrolase
MVRPLVLRKCDGCWFAHCLSHAQIKLFMRKGERISRLDEELTSENVDLGTSDITHHPFYRAYFRCWNEQRYYEAHDVLEQLWLKTNSGDADFFKGLIQAAGAFVHLQKNFEQPSHPKHSRRLKPAVRLFQLAEKNLAPYAPVRHALDIAALLEVLRAEREKITHSDFQTNPWSPHKAPKLRLKR